MRVQALTRNYWNIRDEIHEAEGLLFLVQKLIVPQELQKNILQCIHEGHLGIKKCKSSTRQILYWPGISSDIENMITKCTVCLK